MLLAAVSGAITFDATKPQYRHGLECDADDERDERHAAKIAGPRFQSRIAFRVPCQRHAARARL